MACILIAGHAGRHRDLTGGTWPITPEVAEAVAVSVAGEVLREVCAPPRD
jgi:hypothetical protein